MKKILLKTAVIKYLIGATMLAGILNSYDGINYFDNHKESYYNLSMKRVVQNAKDNGLCGEYWEREDGAKMFGQYIIVAADQKIRPYGTTVQTSLGKGIVLDSGTFIYDNPEQVDIATTW